MSLPLLVRSRLSRVSLVAGCVPSCLPLQVAVCIFWVAKASEEFYSGPRLNYSAFSSIIADRSRAFSSPPSYVTQSPSRELPRPSQQPPPVTAKPRVLRPFSTSLDLTQQAEEQLKLVEANKKLKEEAMALARSMDEEDEGWQSVRPSIVTSSF